MMGTLADVLEKIRRPLEYASKDDFKNLHAVRGLDRTVAQLANEGLDLEKELPRKELLRELKVLFLSFDEEPDHERRRKITGALELVGALEKMAGIARNPEPPIPMPAAEPDVPELTRPRMPAPTPKTSDLPAWAQAEGNGGSDDDQDDDEDEDEEELEGAGVLPAPLPASQGGTLPAGATPPQGTPAAPGEGRRRRRRRGGRGRRRDGAPGGAPSEPGARPPQPQGARPSGSQPPRPQLVQSGRPMGAPSAAQVAAAAGVKILAAEPPIPTRPMLVGPERRPVVRPGDPLAVALDIDADSQPEHSNPEALALPIALTGGLATNRPPAPRIDDVKAVLAKLDAPITEAKGVGPKIAETLAQMGVRTVCDAITEIPRAYQDRRKLKKIAELTPGRAETVMGTIQSRGATRVGMRPGFEVVVADESGQVRCKWFHVHRGMEDRFPVGAKVVFAGKFEKFKDKLEVVHPEIEVLEAEDGPDAFARITPVYGLTEGLSQKVWRKIQSGLVEEQAKDYPPATPFWVRQKRGLPPPAEAIARLHDPKPEDDVQALTDRTDPFHRALAFDELFALQVGLALRRRSGSRERAPQLKILHGMMAKLATLLPYPLTDAQEKVLAEIKRDLMSSRPMHRLLQGDVGSGKTIVALMAALVAIENRHQVALMAPTEILAEQHYLFVKGTLERIGVRAALLLGAGKRADRDETIKKVAHGEVDLVVGTHSLIQEGVSFKQLSLAIIDEQHRFGVGQRAALRQKGQSANGGSKATVPHVLIMTATPIPRTLALTEFGDLDVSVIDRMPPGRAPVETRVAGEEERSMIYAQIRSDVSSGRQAFIVFPAVEGDDAQTIADATTGQKKLQRDVFPEFRVGLLHGQMSREEKEGMMTRFKNGAVDILATTTVVEVGIDVPNATVMLVEHAERFGLAQLHQLRGRVGRGGAKSRCFFMIAPGASEDARERIGVLERTADGFEVAQADLEQRGPGDLGGARQAGMPSFKNADPLKDLDLMVQAREDAFAMVAADPKLRDPEHRVVHEVVKHRWKGRLGLADVG